MKEQFKIANIFKIGIVNVVTKFVLKESEKKVD